MYYVTQQHGNAFPGEVERLWSTVATNRRNVIPILEFVISYGMRESAPQVNFTHSSLNQVLVADMISFCP